MDLKILHIDDEKDIIDKVQQLLNDEVVSGYTLKIADSCGFEDGMQKLASESYDLVILDLCTGSANEDSDKVGLKVFEQIQKLAFVPIVFFTGLPKYVRDLESDIVKVIGKPEGFEALIAQIGVIIDSGFLKIRQDVEELVREGVRSYFWEFVHKNSPLIAQMKDDKTSLKYLLLRRLGKSLSYDLARSTDGAADFKVDHSHPMEFYIYPALEGEYEAGDLVRSKADNSVSVILTPSCDFVIRDKGVRNAEKILLAHTTKIVASNDYTKLQALKATQKEKADSGKMLSEEDKSQLKNLEKKVKDLMRPGKNDRYFFLPPTPFIDAVFIDFQDKLSISYDELDNNYEIVASLDDPIAQAVLSSYSRYHSRIGYRDLDVDYVFTKL